MTPLLIKFGNLFSAFSTIYFVTKLTSIKCKMTGIFRVSLWRMRLVPWGTSRCYVSSCGSFASQANRFSPLDDDCEFAWLASWPTLYAQRWSSVAKMIDHVSRDKILHDSWSISPAYPRVFSAPSRAPSWKLSRPWERGCLARYVWSLIGQIYKKE